MAQELAFLFDETRRFLGVDLSPADVRSVWVGLRPLVGAGDSRNTAGLSREHVVLQEA
ncbi:MAG: Aerobic glycerol-3-phosphate dehydrogenase, partial [Pseudomonadota bacterium]